MTDRGLALVGLRLLATWFIADGVIRAASLPYYLGETFEPLGGTYVFSLVLPLLVSVAVGVHLWLSAERLSARLAGRTGEASETGPLRGDSILPTVLAAAGVVLIAQALPRVVQSAVLFLYSRRRWDTVLGPEGYSTEQQALIWDVNLMASTVEATAQVAVGAALVIGPRRFAAAVHAIRGEFRSTLTEPPEDAESRDSES